MTEENKLGALTSTDKTRLALVKAKFETVNERGAGSLPLINEGICDELRHLLNMNDSGRIDNPCEEYPFNRASKITEILLDYFSQDKSGTGTEIMLRELTSWTKKAFPANSEENYIDFQNAASIGFCLVIKAFRMQLGQEFFQNLKKVDPGTMLKAFNGQETRIASGLSLVERAINKIGIPKDQVFLEEFVKEFAYLDSGCLGPQVESGAILGFSVIEKLWPKLKPGADTNGTNPQGKQV